jgi:hypothetical protein
MNGLMVILLTLYGASVTPKARRMGSSAYVLTHQRLALTSRIGRFSYR